MPKIFNSYARDQSHGQNLAAEAEQQLQAAGFEVFRDISALKPGDFWLQKLEFELENSDAVVLIVSEKVRKSKWVQNEISMAEEMGLSVIPVFAEKIRPPLWLRHLHALDFCQQKNWLVLIAALPSISKLACTVSTQVEISQPIVNPASPVEEKLASLYDEFTWASASGTDQYGIYADLEFKGVLQRFRYIQVGSFMMGSPESEPERYDDETLHRVTLTNLSSI